LAFQATAASPEFLPLQLPSCRPREAHPFLPGAATHPSRPSSAPHLDATSPHPPAAASFPARAHVHSRIDRAQPHGPRPAASPSPLPQSFPRPAPPKPPTTNLQPLASASPDPPCRGRRGHPKCRPLLPSFPPSSPFVPSPARLARWPFLRSPALSASPALVSRVAGLPDDRMREARRTMLLLLFLCCVASPTVDARMSTPPQERGSAPPRLRLPRHPGAIIYTVCTPVSNSLLQSQLPHPRDVTTAGDFNLSAPTFGFYSSLIVCGAPVATLGGC
jgi:hypothetical protein